MQKYDCKIINKIKYKNSDNTISNFSALSEIIKLSKHDWVFILDTDGISIETANEINEIVKKNNDNEIVFRMPRKYIVNSEIIDNCITYPSYQIRLFRKDGIYGYENELHEIIRVRDNVRIYDLNNHLYVYQPSIRTQEKMELLYRYQC